MKVFITGGKGMIGQAIAKAHERIGDEVYVWDNHSNPYIDYSIFVGHDASHETLNDAIALLKPDIISHQAALVSVGQSQYQIERYLSNNIDVTGKLLEAILDANYAPKMIMHAGSMGPYGEGPRSCLRCGTFYVNEQRKSIEIHCPKCCLLSKSLPTKETQELRPLSQYAVSKMAQEAALKVFAETYGVRVCSLRYFSVYSMTANPANPYTGVLSVIANKLLNSATVELNEDGLQTRDLICADDIGNLHQQLTRSQLPLYYSVFNVGTGKSWTLTDIYLMMSEALNINKDLICNMKIRPGDIKDSSANIDKLQAFVSWEPFYTVPKAIYSYADFILDNPGRFIVQDTCKQADAELKKRGLL